MKKICSVWLVVCAAGLFWVSGAQAVENLLQDPGFEGGINEPYAECWRPFNNCYCTPLTPRTGTFVSKIYGNFNSSDNESGIWQDVPAAGGKYYQATAYMRQNAGDSLDGDNKAFLKLEFYGPNGPLKVYESPIKIDGKGAKGKYVFVTTGRCGAPEGTVMARWVAIFKQGKDNAKGCILVDDVALTEVP